jgi:hypothetical protein
VPESAGRPRIPLRSLLLLAVPAVAAGAVAAVAAREFSGSGTAPATHDGPPSPGVDADATESRAPVDDRRGRPRRPRARARASIDPELVAALDGEDETARRAAALALLRLGTGRLDALHELRPERPEARALLARIEEALGTLALIEAGQDWPKLSEEDRLSVRLKYWGKVLPEADLREERLAYWRSCVATDVRRLAKGSIAPGEAKWHELELARVRREAGEIDDAEWRRIRDAGIDEVRAWAASLRGRRDVTPARAAEAEAAAARLAE